MTAHEPVSPPEYPFQLDDFQRRAMTALDAGKSVLVAAPTGSGKTVVAEHAVAEALAGGGKAFYTTPIKALSNQKFADLAGRHGPAAVGLLTGDNAVNGDAPVVVMTTEVLRNMIHAASPALDSLAVVVLDEVHYLQNPYRGTVWEEVIIHLAPEVRLVCLSATVSNAEELATWLSTVRGETAAVIEERRPVELHNLYMAADRGLDRLHLLPTLVEGRPNAAAARLDGQSTRGHHGRRRLATPRRPDVVERLAEEAMLPAIAFVFSRAGCDAAVRQCLEAGVRLTTSKERSRIRDLCDERTGALGPADLEVLGWSRWMAGMEAGVAAHHAGMVPPFKEAVERCFAAGLVKVVFATETLSLGINMPARAVVIESLTKFTGRQHERLTPGDYVQLTGRAGRRGTDEIGYGVVLWSPFVPFDQVAALVSTRTQPVSSAFRPTYNMTANLVGRFEPSEAHHLLNLSFAQFQADDDVVRLESRLERVLRRRARAEAEAACHRGDAAELVELERRLGAARASRPSRRRDLEAALAGFRPGDVLALTGGKSAGRAVVLSATERRGAPRLRVLTPQRRRLTLGPADLEEAPARLGRIDLPTPYAPNSARFQKAVAAALARAPLGPRPVDGEGWHDHPEVTELVAAVAEHPVSACPDAGAHRRALRHAAHARAEEARLRAQVDARAASLGRQLDQVVALLGEWGHLDGWSLTDSGRRLSRLYHETDLLVATCLDEGVLDGLEPADLAGLASVFSYEARRPENRSSPRFGSAELRRRWDRVEAIHARLVEAEERAGLPPTRAPDPGFVAAACGWARGDGLADLLDVEDLSGGDFVRNVKQLIDLLRQLAGLAEEVSTAESARAAADALFRGAVAASSVMTVAGLADRQG